MCFPVDCIVKFSPYERCSSYFFGKGNLHYRERFSIDKTMRMKNPVLVQDDIDAVAEDRGLVALLTCLLIVSKFVIVVAATSLLLNLFLIPLPSIILLTLV